MKKLLTLSVIAGVVVSLFVLLPTQKTLAAGGCTASVNFNSIASPFAYNDAISAIARITLSGFDNGGANDGYCSYSSITSFTYKTVYTYFDFGSPVDIGAFPPTSVTLSGNKFKVTPFPLQGNDPPFNVATVITPSEYGFKEGDIMHIRVQVLACDSGTFIHGCVPLTTSSYQNIQLKGGIFSNFACTGPDSSGQTVYICDTKNVSNCSNTVGCTSKQPCTQLADSSMCGKPVSAQATHKECQNNACKIVAGTQLAIGAKSCTSDTDCAATSGTTGGGTQTFNLTNPIGITSFQDLIGIIGTWIFNLAIPVAIIIIIYAGIMMLTAGPNPANFKKGKDALKYAVIGLAIVLIGKGFVSLIQSILNLKNG
jgi:hypothetical protein